MSANKSAKGRIMMRGVGAGGITRKDIERRARELAAIKGRAPAEITERDLELAREELMGGNLPPTIAEDNKAAGAITRDPSEPPSDTGRQTPDIEGSDEQVTAERLAEEGIEEAQHEQMLQARRQADREDKGKE